MASQRPDLERKLRSGTRVQQEKLKSELATAIEQGENWDEIRDRLARKHAEVFLSRPEITSND